jgi:hypothetical protein
LKSQKKGKLLFGDNKVKMANSPNTDYLHDDNAVQVATLDRAKVVRVFGTQVDELGGDRATEY